MHLQPLSKLFYKHLKQLSTIWGGSSSINELTEMQYLDFSEQKAREHNIHLFRDVASNERERLILPLCFKVLKIFMLMGMEKTLQEHITEGRRATKSNGTFECPKDTSSAILFPINKSASSGIQQHCKSYFN